jgi:hypothetical protein
VSELREAVVRLGGGESDERLIRVVRHLEDDVLERELAEDRMPYRVSRWR